MNIRQYQKNMHTAQQMLRDSIGKVYAEYNEEVERLHEEFFGDDNDIPVRSAFPDDENVVAHKYGRDR